jgi:hypothetical protein
MFLEEGWVFEYENRILKLKGVKNESKFDSYGG